MLWIITQNKQSLVSVKEVTIKGKNIQGIIGSASMDEWSETLGRYQSNERAMEILKEIFKRIEDGNGISVTFSMPEK